MRINENVSFYRSQDMSRQTSGVSQNGKKSVLLTDHREVATAVHKGRLTVDGVTLELSEDVRNAIQEADNRQFQDNEAVMLFNTAVYNANVAEQQGDTMKQLIKDQAKALEIARRIASGGQVPMQDEKALMEYSSELYQMAKQAAIMAKEHQKYDTLMEESEETQNYDADEGTLDVRYAVQVDVSMGDSPAVEGVSVAELHTEDAS